MEKVYKIFTTVCFVLIVGIFLISKFYPTGVTEDELKGYLEKISPMAQETSSIMQQNFSILSLNPSTARTPAQFENISAAKYQFLAYSEEMGKMEVPSGLKKYHKEMKSAFSEYSRGFELVEKAFEEKNDTKMSQANDVLNKAATQFFNTSQELVKVKTE